MLLGAENSIGGLLDDNHLIICGGFNINATNDCNLFTTLENEVATGTGSNQVVTYSTLKLVSQKTKTKQVIKKCSNLKQFTKSVPVNIKW